MKISTRFLILFSFIGFSMLIILTGVILILRNQESIYDSQISRYYAYKIGDDLRQSSDDLTEYCLNYVIIGDSIWENKYWELFESRKKKWLTDQQSIPTILDSALHIGFNNIEFELLKTSLDKSNDLVWVETIAFNAAKGLFLDSLNQFSVQKKPDPDFALDLLRDQEYLLMKQEIIDPITKFESLIESRTSTSIEQFVNRGRFFLRITIVLIVLTVIISVIGYIIIRDRLKKEELISFQLSKRVKELACLHKISQLTENTKHSVEHVMDGIVMALPYAWKYTDKTFVRINFKNQTFSSTNFQETEWKYNANIKGNNVALGTLEVFYTELRPDLKNTVFYREEIALINTIVNLIVGYYERKQNEENLIKINTDLRAEIKERKLIEKQLERSKLRFKTLVNNMPGVFYNCSIKEPWQVSYLTNQIENLSGYPKEDFLGDNPRRNLGDITHPDDKEQVAAVVEDAIKTNKPYRLAYRVIHNNKQIRYVIDYGQVIYKDDGTPDYLIGGMFDDSQRMKATLDLEESEERFQLAAKGSNAGIWDLDVESNQMYWSDIHYKLLGYITNEIIPSLSFLRECVHQDDLEVFDRAVNNHINNGKELNFEARFYTKQNEIKWFRNRGESSRDENGKSVRIVGTFSDITRQKEAENALAAKEQQLQYALDVSNEGIWEWNLSTNSITFSLRCFSMIGYLPVEGDEQLINFWKMVVHKDDESKALINNIENISISGLHDSIYRIVSKSKDIKWIHTKGKAVEFSPNGKPARVIGTMSDITNRMKQEEQIVSAILETEDKERSRIARDIHDGLQQTMSTALMSLEKVRSSTDFKDEKVYEKFHQGYRFLKKSIEESRTLAHNLMPKVVDKNGLVAAIQSLLTAIENSSNTKFTFEQNMNDERLKLSEEMTFYRIIQEAVNNVIKYANAPKCNIQLLKHSDMVVLTIEDNGNGFDIANTSNTFGLNSMKTRADSIGAFFEINSRVNKGTQILLELSLK